MYFSHVTEQAIFKPLNFNGRDVGAKIHLSLDNKGNFVAHVYALNDHGHMCNASWAAQSFLNRFPERKSLTRAEIGIHVAIPSTDVSVQILHKVWPHNKLFFDDDARIIYAAKLFDIDSASIVSRQTSQYKKDKTVPEHSLILHPENPLTCYQQVAAVNTSLSDGYGLLMDMGTGKTPVVITHICNEAMKPKYDNGKMLKAIVVCPPALCLNWQEEFHKFGVTQGQVSVLRGTAATRIETWACGLVPHDDGNRFSVFIIPYDSMCTTWEYLEKTPGGFDIAVLDESHLMANTKTRRYKHCRKLRDISKQRIALTGTPIRNNALDLYALFEFLGEGYSGFKSERNFKAFYGVFEKAYDDGFDKFIGIQNAPFIKERLARHSFSVTKKEALPDLPDKLYDVHEVQMAPKQLEYYKDLASKLVLEIEHTMAGNTMNSSMVVEHVLTKLLRLAQVTSGFLVFSPEVDEDTLEVVTPRRELQIFENLTDNPKISALLELMKDKGPDDKTIVWACFKPDIRNITQALTDAGIDSVEYYGETRTKQRDINVKRFNCDTDCKVLVGNPSAGGVGLNLLGYDPANPDMYTTNCSHMVYYSQGWSYVVRDQSESRPHRRGTRVPVRITDLSVPDTIDTEIRARVMDKKKHALGIMDIDDLLRKLL